MHTQRCAFAHRPQSLLRADIGLYGEEAPRSGPLVLEKGLEGRSLDDVLLWLDAVYKQVGPATLEGAKFNLRCSLCEAPPEVSADAALGAVTLMMGHRGCPGCGEL